LQAFRGGGGRTAPPLAVKMPSCRRTKSEQHVLSYLVLSVCVCVCVCVRACVRACGEVLVGSGGRLDARARTAPAEGVTVVARPSAVDLIKRERSDGLLGRAAPTDGQRRRLHTHGQHCDDCTRLQNRRIVSTRRSDRNNNECLIRWRRNSFESSFINYAVDHYVWSRLILKCLISVSCRCSNERVNAFCLVLFTFVSIWYFFALYVYFANAIQPWGCNMINIKGV